MHLWTWAGLRANASIATELADLLGSTALDNLSIKLDPELARDDDLRRRLEALDVNALHEPAIASEYAEKLKFADCVPQDLAVSIATKRLHDPAAVARVANEPV